MARRASPCGVPALAVILRRLAVVLAAVVVCATVAGFWRDGTFLAATAMGAAARPDADVGGGRVRVVAADQDAAHPELAAIVFDEEQDEDDDLRSDGIDAVACAEPPRAGPLDPGLRRSDALSIETSRFAVDSALPRGPPAGQA